MWERTKRMINSYLDDLINRASHPEREARSVTRAEIARLNELEVQARASAKMFEKELAETELKIIGVSEREQIARQQGDSVAASNAAHQIAALLAQRDLLAKQLAEANSSAARARSLREDRSRLGEELATETHLTAMRENLAGIQSPFDASDPAATIEEMKARLNRSSAPTTQSRVTEADRELEAARTRSEVEEILARYKGGAGGATAPTSEQAGIPRPAPAAQPDPASHSDDEAEPEQPKTLGRFKGPLNPID